MRIFNFKRNYSDNFRSLDDIAEKLDELERRGNGHSNNNKNNNDFDPSKLKSPYPNVRYPNVSWFGTVIIEHPYWSPDDILRHVRLRMKIRHARPDMYKTPELARGDEYLPDMYEEYKEELLNSELKERLKLQRIRRQHIGTITSCKWDEKRGVFIYDVMMEEGDDWDGPITREKHLELLNQQREDI